MWLTFWRKEKGEKALLIFLSPYSLTLFYHLPYFKHMLLSSLIQCRVFNCLPLEEGRVWLSFVLGAWRSGKRESRGLCFVWKKRRQTWGRKYYVTRKKDYAFKSLSEIQATFLFPLPTPLNYSGFDPISLSFPLSSDTQVCDPCPERYQFPFPFLLNLDQEEELFEK